MMPSFLQFSIPMPMFIYLSIYLFIHLFIYSINFVLGKLCCEGLSIAAIYFS